MSFTVYRVLFFILCVTIATLAQGASYADSDQITVNIKTAGTDTKPLNGMWVELKDAATTVQSGFTPLTFNATQGVAYTIYVSDYGNYVFDHWDDGDTSYFRTIQPTTDTFLVAYFHDKSVSNTQSALDAQIAQQSLVPEWLKQAAKSWLDGSMSDTEFVASLQQLIDQKILVPPAPKQSEKQEGFSNIQCTSRNKHVEMVGKYTNGETPYAIVSIRMILYDADDNILASNTGTISNIGAHESRYFNVITKYHLDYASCDAQIDNVIPK